MRINIILENPENGVLEDEEIDVAELDESVVIANYSLKSLNVFDDAFAWIQNSAKKYCIIAVLGKSRFGKTLNQGLVF